MLKEIYVKVPCKDAHDAQKLRKEISALYTKQFTDKSLNKSLNAKLNSVKKTAKQKTGEVQQERAAFDDYKAEQLQEIEQMKSEAIRESQLYRNLNVSVSNEQLNAYFKDSVTRNLINDTISETVHALGERGYLNDRGRNVLSSLESVELRKSIINKLQDKMIDFVDRVKEHMIKMLERTHRHHISR